MQDWQRDPQYEECEGADEGAEGVGEDHAATWTAACRGACEALVQDLVEAVEYGTSADDEVSSKPVLGLGIGGCGGVVGGVTGVRGDGCGVTIGHHEDAYDGHEDGEGFVGAQRLFKEGDGEGVGKEGGAVVDCS